MHHGFSDDSVKSDEVPDVLRGRRIAIGVTGGIAAYKACSLVSALRQRGAEVRVVMTRNATEFVTPMTFAVLSGHPAEHDMWAEREQDSMSHISLQEFAEVMLVAPATANILGKVAHGISDDLLSTSIMAATCPVGFAPAMNAQMWCKAAVQENVATLRKRGFWMVGPAYGALACGVEGAGRLASERQLIATIERMLTAKTAPDVDLNGRKVVITGGPTREFMDPVRFMSNPSSGKMGFALAEAAAAYGANVTLVSGASPQMAGLDSVSGYELIEVCSAAEMLAAVEGNISGADVFISAAAVADYTFSEIAPQKIKKLCSVRTVELARTVDILAHISLSANRPQIVVGFAAESQDILLNAAAKLEKKKLDLIVANSIVAADSGFASDTNLVSILGPNGYRHDLPLMSKAAVASAVLEEVSKRMS